MSNIHEKNEALKLVLVPFDVNLLIGLDLWARNCSSIRGTISSYQAFFHTQAWKTKKNTLKKHSDVFRKSYALKNFLYFGMNPGFTCVLWKISYTFLKNLAGAWTIFQSQAWIIKKATLKIFLIFFRKKNFPYNGIATDKAVRVNLFKPAKKERKKKHPENISCFFLASSLKNPS